MTEYEGIFENKRKELKEHKDLLTVLDTKICTVKAQLESLEVTKTKTVVKAFEVEKSIQFMSGLITALNNAFDKEVEEAKQKGFEEGYSSKTAELKSKKPTSISAAVRKKRLQKKKK